MPEVVMKTWVFESAEEYEGLDGRGWARGGYQAAARESSHFVYPTWRRQPADMRYQ